MTPKPGTSSSTPNASTTPGASIYSSLPQWTDTEGIASSDLAKADLAKVIARKVGEWDLLWFMEHVLGIQCFYTEDPFVRRWIRQYGIWLKEWLDTRWDRDEDGNLKQKVPFKILKVLPRKTFKTSTNEAAVPWLLLHDPNLVCGIMSADYEKLAVPIAKAMRGHLEGTASNNRVADVYGDLKRADSWAGDKFTIATRTDGRRDPSLQAYGARSGAVGHHFDVMGYDDLVTNEAMRNNADWLNIIVKTWIDGKATINPNGLVDITMTRYHDNDLAGYVIKHEIEPGIKRALGKLPDDWSPEDGAAIAKYAHLAGWHVIYEHAVDDPDGPSPTYRVPKIWSAERVAEVRSGQGGEDDSDAHEYSELFFWCQLQNQPQKRADNPIQDIHIETALGVPQRWSISEAPRTGWVDIYCDLALKDQEAYLAQRGDYTVAHVVAQREGFVWRINGYRGKPTQDIFGDALVRLAMWARNEFGARIRYVTYDKLTGQGSGDRSTEMWLLNQFRRYPTLNTPIIKPLSRAGTKKEAKVLGTAWAWQEGWVRLCEEAPGNDPLVYQMQRIGYTRPDDDADAFADAFHPDIYNTVANASVDSEEFDWEPALTLEGVDDGEEDQIWKPQWL